MKKKMIPVAILILLVVVVGIFLGFNKNGADIELFEKVMLNVDTKEALEILCDKEALKFVDEGDFYTVYDVDFLNQKAQLNYTFEQGSTSSIRVSALLFGYKKDDPYAPVEFTEKQLKNEIQKFLNAFCEMQGVTLDNRFFIFEQAELIDNASEESYKKIMAGNAYLEFSLRDSGGNYWTIATQKMNDGVIFLIVDKYVSSELYAEEVPNIDTNAE